MVLVNPLALSNQSYSLAFYGLQTTILKFLKLAGGHELTHGYDDEISFLSWKSSDK